MNRKITALLLYAPSISFIILALFYYWFAIADRYAVFLYEHLGATPFDEATSSRYWMAGLVACGFVLVGYTSVNWLLGRLATEYRPPAWWLVWACCVPSLLIGIPAITMNLSWPTLPLPNTLTSVAATLAGLALALMSGAWAARRPWDLAWLALDGLGLLPALTMLRAVELADRGLSSPLTHPPLVYLVAAVPTLAGAAWLIVMTGLRVWRRTPMPGTGALFAAGLALSYVLMPLAHYILATPPEYKYITTASNFFAFDVAIQLLAFSVAAALAFGIAGLRQRVHSASIITSLEVKP
ncbi:MAG: hypothetical protein KKA73_04590 [Chloroflexi bacterium]|nr:hypothetical protein [Chloroflexota bacterium]MBU1746945.1 hypothetical protein [Chloroflexota bacterium]MBU1879215.1 hypothetical protein [Chloroflexota bacterium]